MYPKLQELKARIKSSALLISQTNQGIFETQKSHAYAGDLQRKAHIESGHCRHMLIAYGLLRGRQYEEIERPAEGNKPSWSIIESFKKEYAHHEEDVRTCT